MQQAAQERFSQGLSRLLDLYNHLLDALGLCSTVMIVIASHRRCRSDGFEASGDHLSFGFD